jgi:hypothetical protein
LPRLHPLLAPMARPVGSGGIGWSCCPGLAGAPQGCEVDAACRGKSESRPRCTVGSEEGRVARHLGSSSAPVNVSPCRLVHFARRHYRLAPVVTTRTVGAGRERRDLQAQVFDCADRSAGLWRLPRGSPTRRPPARRRCGRLGRPCEGLGDALTGINRADTASA